jgi:hypothetical protein
MHKKNSKSILWVVIIMMISSNVIGQQIIKEAGIKFNLADSVWKRNSSQIENTKDVTVYRFKRIGIDLKDDKQISPTISVIVETVQDSLNVMVFSAMKKAKTPFDIEDVIIPENYKMKFHNAIGYRGGYTDKTGTRHTIIMIYLINKNKGVQILMDITRYLYDEYGSEFDELIRSIEVM